MAIIGIDAHAIGERLTGNETYISNLIDQLSMMDSGHEFVLLLTNRESANMCRQKYPQMRSVLMRPENPLVRLPLVMPWLTWKMGLDLLHVQYAGPPLLTAPLVTTIHDISFERYPELFTKRQVMQFKATIPFAVRKAARVLTGSDYSMRDIIETYGTPEGKVAVTYYGVGPEFMPLDGDRARAAVEKYGIPGRYVLTVGNLQPRKNLNRLIEAYSALRNARTEIKHKLVIVGQKAWKSGAILSASINSQWANDIIFTGFVPPGDLPALYSGADAFAYVSLFEGFGLPPLEAMACGTPVVVSNRASLPEVVGDAGLIVDPLDVDAIAAAITTLLLEPQIKDHYRNKGMQRAKRFSWQDCASRTLKVYEEVLQENRRR